MRRVSVESITIGVKLARTVFKSDGGVLLTEGIEMKESYTERLKNYGITEVYVEDAISENVKVEDVIQEQTHHEAVVLVKKMMDNYHFSETLEVEAVKKMVNKIADELLGNSNIIYSLSEIRSIDNYTFEHSVNVCILSLIMGIGLDFDLDKLRDLGNGAIMHDIGKLCIPMEILKKPSQLTVAEFEEIKKHTILGYEILKRSGNISLSSAYIAFGHHERYDGSGYPLQLKNDNIQIFARIVAVADVYDALTSDRVYRKKLKSNEVYEYITSLGANQFDPLVIESFVKYVTIYPVGTGVLLNNKERALVMKANKLMPTRPLVRIIDDSMMYMSKHRSFREIDLFEQTNIFIVDSCKL